MIENSIPSGVQVSSPSTQLKGQVSQSHTLVLRSSWLNTVSVALLYYGVHLQSIFLLMNSTAPQVNKPTEKLKMRTISAFVGTKESITSGRNSQLERYNISPSKEYASFPQFPGKGDLTSGAQKTNIDPIGRRDSNSTTTTGSRSGRRRKQSSGEKFRNLNISS